jgi:hypothetical protein
MTPGALPGRRWPGLLAIGAIGLVTGALALGSALEPAPSPVVAVLAVTILAVVGTIPVALRQGTAGLVVLYAGLLAGFMATVMLRISASEAGWGGFRSIFAVADWRLSVAAFLAAGLFAVAAGYLLAGRLRREPERAPRRPWLFLAGALVGSLTAGVALAAWLGTTALVIPEGAVILRVTVTDGMISLEPPAVPAGEVHVIRSQRGRRFDGPFMESGTGPRGVAGHIFHGPLTDADVAGLRAGRLPGGSTVAEVYAGVPQGEPAPWPTPDEYGGHQRLEPGRYAWWTLEVGADGPRMKDLVIFDAY